MWKFIKKLFGADNAYKPPLEVVAVPSLEYSNGWPFPSHRPDEYLSKQKDERDLNNDGVVDPTEKTIAKHKTSTNNRKKRKFVKREPDVAAPKTTAAKSPAVMTTSKKKSKK